jgi:apolipoprotein N-acyltransferase
MTLSASHKPAAPAPVAGAKLATPAGNWPTVRTVACLAAAIAIGMLLRLILSVEPVWWLAWLAPAPLLVLAFRSGPSAARGLTTLAALIGASVNFPYLQLVMPLSVAVLITLAQVLLWVLVIGATRRIVLRYRSWWTVFAYPVFWVALDTLFATFRRDGNWGSLAYSQSENLPVLQLAALFGVGGMLFLVALVPSALALAVVLGKGMRHASLAYGLPALMLAASLGYGSWRLQQPLGGPAVRVGLAVIDTTGAGTGPGVAQAYAARIWSGYEALTGALAAHGARIVVLPEKIATLDPAQAAAMQAQVSALAARHRIWVNVGVALAQGGVKRNVSWLFGPDGALTQSYQKQHLAPPEHGFVEGAEYKLGSIGGAAYGMAICKDMHFSSFGRAYGQRQVAVMLVPAWDFRLDRWMAARMTLTRGVEGGFAVIRSAREGLLTVSDAYGRVLGERTSSAMPGTSLLVSLPIGAPLPTLYKQIGDAVGWTCVIAAAFLLCLAAISPKPGSDPSFHETGV